MTEREFSRILGWPGYRVYRHDMAASKTEFIAVRKVA
jgi:hypothetical protein